MSFKEFTFVGAREAIPPGVYQVLFVEAGWDPDAHDHDEYTTEAEVLALIAGGGAIPAFIFEQQLATTIWDITHNLGWDPAGVVVLGNDGDTYHPTIEYLTPGVMARLRLPDSITGFAYLS